MSALETRLENSLRNVPDFPKPGIQFKDISPILLDPDLFSDVIDRLATLLEDSSIDVIVGVESRGFIFGAPLAIRLNKPFALARKAGKLPADKIAVSYDLEYGQATLEMHTDAISKGDKALILDDLLATGGTVAATRKLIENLGGEVVAAAFLIELAFLNGREELEGIAIHSLLSY